MQPEIIQIKEEHPKVFITTLERLTGEGYSITKVRWDSKQIKPYQAEAEKWHPECS
jgi:hypothetical protein